MVRTRLRREDLTRPDTRSYVAPVKIGDIMRGACIGQVTASRSSKFPVGSHATASVGWTEYAVVPEKHLQRIDVPSNGKLTDTLGVLGMTGPPVHQS